jgi:hypothetical protein
MIKTLPPTQFLKKGCRQRRFMFLFLSKGILPDNCHHYYYFNYLPLGRLRLLLLVLDLVWKILHRWKKLMMLKHI